MSEAQGSLVRWLERALLLNAPSQLLIGGSGTVSVYPQQHCYVSDIHDWEAAYSVAPEQIRLSPALWAAPPAGAQPLEELRWRAAIHEAHERVAAGMCATMQLVQLVSWPNLARLPEEHVAPVARVCSLLWRKPTVGYLVARIAGLTPESACAVLHVLQSFGHLSSPSGATATQSAPAGTDEEEAPPPSSFVARLWQRLVGF